MIRMAGKKCSTRILKKDEFLSQLNDKLGEELTEYLESEERHKQIEELADMLEVIYAIAEVKGISPQTLEEVRRIKTETRGSFRKRTLLEWVED